MISGRTRVLGVIGHPVEHTASPAMHNAALAATGLDYVYVAFNVPAEGAASVGDSMRVLRIAGLNVTVPHKQAVMAGLDEISPEAQAIGAVNTIANRDGYLCGYNTDAHGVAATLREDGGLERLPSRAVLMGAGGVARAALYVLLQSSDVEEIALLNRTASRAEALAADLDPKAEKVSVGPLDSPHQVRDAGLLINATSIGMEPRQDESPLSDPGVLHDGLVVLDIVYRPLRTRLLEQAEEAGARVVDGLGMFVRQGAQAFEIWTGHEAPVDVMRAAAAAGRAGPTH